MIVAAVAWFVVTQRSPASTNQATNAVANTPARNVNTSSITNSSATNTSVTNASNTNAYVPTTKTYVNTSYGFTLQYPSTYEYFTGSNLRSGLLFNWGINNVQELLFSVSVYPLSRKAPMVNEGQLVILPATREIGGYTAHATERPGIYEVEVNDYLYLIDSAYQVIADAPQPKRDFLSILESLTFTIPK